MEGEEEDEEQGRSELVAKNETVLTCCSAVSNAINTTLRDSLRSLQAVDTATGGISPWHHAEQVSELVQGGSYVSKNTVWPQFKPDMEVLNRTPVPGRPVWFLRQREIHEKEVR